MPQPKDSEPPRISPSGTAGFAGASFERLRPFGWPLFTAVWLLFGVGFVVQVLRTGPSPVELLVFLISMSALVALFLRLMLRYPFPAAPLSRRELWVRVGLLAILAALALIVELAYGSGVPYRFMYVVVAAAVVLPTRYAVGAILAVLVAVGAVYTLRSGWDANPESWGFLVPFPLIGVGMIAVSRLVLTVRKLQAARREIAQLAAAEAVAEERLRFARDLHDLLGHSLSQIALKSELAGRLLPATPETEETAKEIRDIEGVARRSLHEVREAVAGYRQPTIDDELEGAREMLQAAGIICKVQNDAGPLPSTIGSVLAWTVREGVTNVIRHSRADRCVVHLTRGGGQVRAEVRDDGIEPSRGHDGKNTGTGLCGLAERVEANGGDFAAGSLPEGGFRLRVNLPLRDGAVPADDPAARAGGILENGRR